MKSHATHSDIIHPL